ncbi:MAG: hypothetical protein GY765_05335 [bacterium]|nr:hypothetical protein [bacterium]
MKYKIMDNERLKQSYKRDNSVLKAKSNKKKLAGITYQYKPTLHGTVVYKVSSTDPADTN